MAAVGRIQAANIDGRARSPRFIQLQLRCLHDTLARSSEDIRQAILKDSANTSAEVSIELFLALSSVKEQYNTIDFHNLIDEEYSIAKGQDFTSRSIAAGIAYIVPSKYTLFYSTIAPLAAAIAAGNCVILELETTLLEVSALLRKILPQALDHDTFAITEKRADISDFSESCVRVWGVQNDQEPTLKQIVSPSAARVLALVDRTADVKAAALSLVNAAFSFGGGSPYAPDIVLVNEFALIDFSNAVAELAAKSFSKMVSANGSARAREKRRGGSSILSEEELREDGTDIIMSGTNGTVISVTKRNSKLLQRKFNEPVLILHSISSLDDGIDFSNKGAKPLLASFIFAAPAAAKYLSQFIDAYISTINQIPIELLVGPAAPLNHSPSISPRYTKPMFSVPRPQYIRTYGTHASLLTTALSDAGKESELQKIALAELPPDEQPKGGQIGFFEQGILTGLATIAIPTITGMGVLGYYAVRSVLRTFKG